MTGVCSTAIIGWEYILYTVLQSLVLETERERERQSEGKRAIGNSSIGRINVKCSATRGYVHA